MNNDSDGAAQLASMVSLLRELVEQNSYSQNRAGGTAVADIMERELAAIPHLEVQRVASERYAPHLVARSSGASETAEGCVGLIGHHDTVFPPGTFEGFRQDGDTIRGPGVLDMKGGLVICMTALRILGESGELRRLPLRFVSVSDEEIGSPEGGALLEANLRGASCTLTFEAGRAHDAIITQRKGTGSVRAIASGKAAHAGNHHREGANAIWALSKFIDRASTLTDYERGLTLSAGTIQGGSARNTVPDHAEALFDLRFIRAEDGHQAVASMRQMAAKAAAEVSGTTIRLEGGVKRPPLERSPANVALCDEYGRAAEAAGLGRKEASLIGGGSDASTAAAIGIPSIDGLGPRGFGFHTDEEHIEASSLALRLDALLGFLRARTHSLPS